LDSLVCGTETAKVLCATVYNPKLGYDLNLWLKHIKAQSLPVADILVEPDPEKFDYWARNVSYAREQCRRKFLEGDYTHLWFEDIDTLPPKNALEEMSKLDKDVVCAFYPSKPDGVPGWWQMEYIPPHIRDIASKHYGKRVVMDEHIYMGTRPARIHKAGTGCMLIKRKVLEVCPFPEKVPRTWTEDIIYSIIINALGFEIWALPSVRCQHIGPTLAPLKAERNGTRKSRGGNKKGRRRGSRQLHVTPATSIKVVGEPEIEIIELRRR